MTTPSWNAPTPPEPGWAAPLPVPLHLPPGTMVTIGDVICTQTEVITPSGTCPIGQVSWSFTDMSRTTRSIPAWAIVCAVLFFVFCFLGLLFLLAKEDRTEGSVQVVVQGPRLLHQVQLPVASVAQVQDYSARVGYARSLTAAASQMGI
ncbi:hypothetical protein [Kitasatospora sp. NPDC002040]|uniref:hypothetical protein n=1 Tax=Kitasatospora sp. NPDC002040 TaxID=3154661 RepID=UPI0033275C58